MKILFLGDSITDAGRERNGGFRLGMGQGYPVMCAGKLGFDEPDKYEFLNTGISGDRIVDIYARIKKDCWNLKPDVLSLLVGINDVGHEINGENGVEDDRFEAIYRLLIEGTKERFPNIKIMLLEPFCLAVPNHDEPWDKFLEGAMAKAKIVKKLAEEYGLTFIPLQEKFNEACKTAPAQHWIGDGVHPSNAGNWLIAEEWLKAFKTL